ncbi:MAG: hypothetical protein ABIK67_06815 [candidate division WOR-3 bacterium]
MFSVRFAFVIVSLRLTKGVFYRNRENRDGVLYNIVYSRPLAIQIDPIGKEPQLHNLPGTKSYV